MKIVRFKKFNGGGAVKAFFDIETDNFIIRGFRLIELMGRMLVKPPDEKGKNGQYYEIVSCLGEETYEELKHLALEQYENGEK